MAKTKKPVQIYQLKIALRDIKPPIWRRVQTKDCSLGKLHDIIQACMGWQECHLHLFEIAGEEFGDPEQWPKEFEEDKDTLDEHRTKLSQIAGHSIKKFSYVYDMGDGWHHTIQIEKTLPTVAGVHYPRCITGKRACPPEDCGGPWGYGDFVAAINDPQHERHEELLDWIGGEFDPEAFDIDAINEELKDVR